MILLWKPRSTGSKLQECLCGEAVSIPGDIRESDFYTKAMVAYVLFDLYRPYALVAVVIGCFEVVVTSSNGGC